MHRIDSFKNEYSFLSNFYECPIAFDGYFYTTAEHAFQAAKTNYIALKQFIQNCKTPGEAKRAGRLVPIKDEWELIKVSVMYKILRQKFLNPELAEKLFNTGDAELIEGNTWKDTFWGVCNNIGQNNLGKLLMKVRSEISFFIDENNKKIYYVE